MLIDIFFQKQWITYIFLLYILQIILVIFLIFFRKQKQVFINPFKEFEKSITGPLFHFKCPICKGIFAIKKSRGNNKKNIKMTCPNCGKIGVVPSNPTYVEEEIPEKKSIKANFRCKTCNEGITVWAEGTDLYRNIQVFSCPFCGETDTMNRF